MTRSRASDTDTGRYVSSRSQKKFRHTCVAPSPPVFVADVYDTDTTHLGTARAASLRLLDEAEREVVVFSTGLPEEVEDTLALR